MKSDKRFMRIAIASAKSGVKKGQTPFGACIVKDGKVIAACHNTVWKNTDITAHAEIEAIRKACRKLRTVDLSGSTIYTTCEPCPMCFSACHWARISCVVYGARIKDAKKFGFNELAVSNEQLKKHGRTNVVLRKDLLRSENLRLFKTWARSPSRKAY
jgi:guanine deaminase